jgi:RND family efflux transporter MFP subunit
MKKNRPILLIAAYVLVLGSCSDQSDPATKKTSNPASAHFETIKAEKAPVNEVVTLPAQLAAFQEVSIFPKVNGYVKDVKVDIGSRVKEGQVLMILEAPELEQTVVQAQERWARAKSDYTIGKENFERLRQAAQTPGAVSPQDLATAHAKTEADSALANAELANLRVQQTMLAYLTVRAPFSGVITQRNVHPGALVSAESKDKPMLELKEVDHLRLQVDLPETIAANLREKDTVSFFLSAFPGRKFTGHISRKSMNVNAQYRLERVELDVYNPDGSLSPGMYADVVLNTRGNPEALSIPKSAVITSTERKFVLVVRDGKVHKVDVSTGNESADRIEVFGKILPGEEIIVHPSDEIREGTPVSQ